MNKETKNYIRTKLIKAETGKQNESKVSMGNKTMKINLTYMLRGKERKKRKNSYVKLNRGR